MIKMVTEIECTAKTKQCKSSAASIGCLFLSFLKIGMIGFGGGSSLIPVVERELVERRQLLGADEYLKHTIIANITPGALPVKLGATCGYELGGIAGSLVSAYAVSLPGALLTVLILALFSLLGQQAIQYFQYASVGITVFIVFLLTNFITKTVRTGSRKTNLVLCMTAFLFTGGKELREIAVALPGLEHLPDRPIFDITTIQLMLLSFFMILLSQKAKSKAAICGRFAVCGLYALICGKTGAALGLAIFGNWLLGAMVIWLAVLFLIQRNKAEKRSREGLSAKVMHLAGIFVGVPALLLVVGTFAGYRDLARFTWDVALSTVTSFGGGEAYLSVADGIFVQSGYLASDLFYTRLVPVVNALPGPILVKIAVGIGYLYGIEGDASVACLFASTAMCVTVGMCGTLAVFVLNVFDGIRESAFIESLKRNILPVICGMLLSTSCSMLYEAMKITTSIAVPPLLSLVVMLSGVAILRVLHKRLRLHDLVLLAGVAVLSLLILNAAG